MNKFSFPGPRAQIPLPGNMGDALALVRAGKLQEASDLLLGAAHTMPSTAPNAVPPSTSASTILQRFTAKGAPLASTGTIDIADVLAKADLKTPGKASHAGSRKAAPTPQAPGTFQRVAFRHEAQNHPYWLYVPKLQEPQAGRPLVLMLHGCTQDAEAFALGTQMNAAAETAGALVLYPSQAQRANANGCWNWFRPEDQQAGRGEPALLLAMVQDAIATHRVDPRRVYVAGLSAGGAMAAVLGEQYPEVFAAVGVHSGLATGAAQNMMGALSAMNSGAKGWAASQATGARVVPLIVLHGDADTTVHPRNGEQLLEGVAAAVTNSVQLQDNGTTPDGQRYTRTTVQDTSGKTPTVVAEHWLLKGAGHAWSGGDARGSHTAGHGVDASAEMLRFFLEHPQ